MRATRLAPLAPLAALLLGATPALSQQAPVRPEGYKDPGTATIIGLFVPGGGQLWVGGEAKKKGLALLGLGYGSLILLPAVGGSAGSTAPVYLGVAGYFGTTLYGALTADDAANAHNRRLGGRVALLERVQPVVAPGRAGTAVGLSLRF